MAGEQSLRALEKHILMRVLDDKWKEHLSSTGHLRQGIHLRCYAARNPKQEHKREVFELFSQMFWLRSSTKLSASFPYALCRERDEELVIHPPSLESLICIEHTYPEKTVLLDVWTVRDFGGEAYGQEGQAVQWVVPNRLDQFEFPEANHGIIEALNI